MILHTLEQATEVFLTGIAVASLLVCAVDVGLNAYVFGRHGDPFNAVVAVISLLGVLLWAGIIAEESR